MFVFTAFQTMGNIEVSTIYVFYVLVKLLDFYREYKFHCKKYATRSAFKFYEN